MAPLMLGFYCPNGATVQDHPYVMAIKSHTLMAFLEPTIIHDHFLLFSQGDQSLFHWDMHDNGLTLERPWGAPPLFYRTEGDHFIVSNNLSLLSDGIQGVSDTPLYVHSFACHSLLQQGYVSGPYTLMGGVRQLMGGERIQVGPDLTLRYEATLPSNPAQANGDVRQGKIQDAHDISHLKTRTVLVDGSATSWHLAREQHRLYPNAPRPVWVFYDEPGGAVPAPPSILLEEEIDCIRCPLTEKEFWSFLPGALSLSPSPILSPLWPLYLWAFHRYPDRAWAFPRGPFPLLNPSRRLFEWPGFGVRGLWERLPRRLRPLLHPWSLNQGELFDHYGAQTAQEQAILINALQIDASMVSPLSLVLDEMGMTETGAFIQLDDDKNPIRSKGNKWDYPLSWVHNKRGRFIPLIARQSGIEDIMTRTDVAFLLGHGSPLTKWGAYRLLLYALWHQHHVMGIDLPADTPSALIKKARRQ